ncbi:MAG TPA: glycosyltransferase family 4 protein, partial [Candidatus Saccharimonadia bacterium]|nr:glycosyltransferase family 4 protein [Candidatus Saccharimonadia bacterium]
VFKLLVPRSVAKADAVICISRSAAEAAVSRGVPAEKISVIPLAVNDDIFGTSSREELIHQLDLPAESKLLLTVGRLVQRKGVEWFIASVLPGLAGQFPGIVYLVAGDGPARPDIEAAIARNHMENHVRLLGRVSPELLAAAYNGVDVFVMPNIQVPGDMEGFGLVLLEAAMCERPIVASSLEGIEEAVQNDKNGKLVHTLDTETFRKQLELFLKNSEEAQAFGKQARQFTQQNYSWPTIAERYVEIYRRLDGLQ